jgi:hypothetical protein
MPAFPHHLCTILHAGSERPDPVVLRSEVERGLARQRRSAADARVQVSLQLGFETLAAADEFEAWFYGEALGGAAWFSFTHPRGDRVVTARVVGGSLGAITPLAEAYRVAERTVDIEYIRPSFVVLPPGLHPVSPSRVLATQRNSAATFVDSAGVLQTAAANVPRFQGGQLLVEADSTNLALQSQALNLAPWGGQCSAGLSTPPWAGSVPIFGISKTTSTSSEARTQTVSGAVPAGGQRSLSIAILGHASTPLCDVGLADSAFGWGDAAGSTAQIISGPGSITQVNGALWRVSGLTPAAHTLIRITRTYAAASANAGIYIYPGSFSSITIGHTVLATRVQLEAGPAASSYIPTTTAPATRAADLIQVAA